MIVRIAGEGRWLLPSEAEEGVRQLDNAVALAVDEADPAQYRRLLRDLCAFVRTRGEVLQAVDHAGDADITVPPPELSLDSAIDALFDGSGLGADGEHG